MNRPFALRKNQGGSLAAHTILSLCALLLCCNLGAFAQSTAPPVNERAIQRSSYSSPRPDEHEAQLQRNSVNSRRRPAI